MNLEHVVVASPGPAMSRRQGLAALILVGMLVTVALTPVTWLAVAWLAALAIPLLVYVALALMEGDGEVLLLLWVLIFPLGYYFLSYPKGGSLFNFDRAIVGLLTVGICLYPKDRLIRLPVSLRRCGWAWSAFLAAGIISMVQVKELRGSARVLLEAFLLPGILSYYVIACFPVRRYLRVLHGLISVMAMYSAAIGVAEIILGTDLLPIPGAGEYFAGQHDLLVLRVNGPFLTNNSYGLIGMVTFCLLWFLWRAAGDSFPGWQKLLHVLGMTSALLSALLPLFRSIVLTFAIIFFLALFRAQTLRKRLARIAGLLMIATVVLAAMGLVPDLYEERMASSENVYGRLAQQKQNLKIFLADPMIGVGLNNYHEYASHKAQTATSFEGVEALEYPHSNLGAVLAETGLVGFLPYAASQVLLVVAFWKLRARRTECSSLVQRFSLYVFLSYWISGLALTSGYSSDLNLWYMFSLAVLYKYALTDTEVEVERLCFASA